MNDVRSLEDKLTGERQDHTASQKQLQSKIAAQQEEICNLNSLVKDLRHERQQYKLSQEELQSMVTSQREDIKHLDSCIYQLHKQHADEVTHMKEKVEQFQKVLVEEQDKILEKLARQNRTLQKLAWQAQLAVHELKEKVAKSSTSKATFKVEMLKRAYKLRQVQKVNADMRVEDSGIFKASIIELKADATANFMITSKLVRSPPPDYPEERVPMMHTPDLIIAGLQDNSRKQQGLYSSNCLG
jgi:predicted RNase H-like nuclease (RuvC/YqgF family)